MTKTMTITRSPFIYFPTIVATLLCLACRGKGTAEVSRRAMLDSTRATRVELPEKVFDFGNIAPGEVVGHAFRVRNAGEKDLFIVEVESACGCTTTSYTRGPVKPGEEGTIEVKFDSAGRYGRQYKSIHVVSNVRERYFELAFKANIQN